MRYKILLVVLALLACVSGADAKWYIPSNWTCTFSGGFVVCTYIPVFPQTCGADVNGTKVYCR